MTLTKHPPKLSDGSEVFSVALISAAPGINVITFDAVSETDADQFIDGLESLIQAHTLNY